MHRARVLHVITRLDRGGSADNTLLTVHGLRTRGFDVALVAGKTAHPSALLGTLDLRKGRDWIEIEELIREVRPLKDLVALIKLYLLIRGGRFDMVHTHSSKAGLLGRWAAKMAQVPILVHTPHGHIFYGYYGTFVSYCFVLLERFTALVTDRIITLTAQEAEDHVQLRVARPDRFLTVHSGVELEGFLNRTVDVGTIRWALGIPEDYFVVGTVGRLCPIKGQSYLMEAARTVVEKIPQTCFLMVGDGELRPELEAQTERLGIAGHVRFLGWRDDVADVLSVMDVFVLPSLNEGLGRAVVEAMAMGKAVVASAVGGVPEVLENGRFGVLVPPRDSEQIAAAVLDLLTDERKREALGKAAKKRAEDFGVEAMVERIERLYQELWDAKRGPRSKVQGPRSKVQGPRVQGPRVEGPGLRRKA